MSASYLSVTKTCQILSCCLPGFFHLQPHSLHTAQVKLRIMCAMERWGWENAGLQLDRMLTRMLCGRLVSELPLSPLRLQCAQSVQGHCRKKEHIRVQHPAPGTARSHWNMFPWTQRDIPGTRYSSAFGGLTEQTMQPNPCGTPLQ